MQFYMAPMEGLTGYVFRNAYQKYFGDIDKYFTPFLTNKKLNYKETNDVLPEHNKHMQVIPQILTNRTDVFFEIAQELKQYGYQEVNLNLGCPSQTVVTKKRGAGFLAVPEELDIFLEEIYEKCPLKISIKTRIGIESAREWERLLEIYEKYPLTELIIHPRVQKDFYKNKPDIEAFAYALEHSRHSLCYNGEIHGKEAFDQLCLEMQGCTCKKQVEKIMLGRGILKNPALAGVLKGTAVSLTPEKLQAFHDEILEGYIAIMSGDRNTLFRMKELWSYLGNSLIEPEKYLKKIRKAQRIAEYEAVVNVMLKECQLQENIG